MGSIRDRVNKEKDRYRPLSAKAEELKELKEFEGYFLETKHNQGQKGNSQVHCFKTKDGNFVNIWGFAVLNDHMKDIKPGTFVAILYDGMQKPKGNGDPYHGASVYIDSAEDPLDVSDRLPENNVSNDAYNGSDPGPSVPPEAEEDDSKYEDDLPF